MAAVSLFTRIPGSTIQHAINEATEQPSVSELVGTQAARVLWGDAVATSVAIGGGAAMATLSLAQGVGVTTINVGTAANPAINLGGAASLVTVNGSQVIQGDLTVNGTTTALNTVNVTITDAILLIAAQSVPAPQVPSAWTIERGTSGDDALVYWNTTNDRFELGLFDTVGGTVAPAGVLAVTTDLRLEDLIVAGTSITGESALDVTATAADLTLAATGANTVVTQTNGLDRWFAASDGGQEYVGLAADPSVSAAGDARLIYNSVSNTLRVSFNGVAYVDVATSTTVSLQGAYNNGATIATSTAQGVIGFSGSAANNDNVLSVAKTPAGAQTGSALAVSSNANASSTTFTVTRSAAAGLSALFSGGTISCPDGVASERFGSLATATGAAALAVGESTIASGVGCTSVGRAAESQNVGGTAIGANTIIPAGATADSVALGQSAFFTAAGGGVKIGSGGAVAFTNVVAIGLATTVGGSDSVTIGAAATVSATATVAIGVATTAGVSGSVALGGGAAVPVGATADSIAVGHLSTFTAAGGGVIVGNATAVAVTGVVIVGLGASSSSASCTVVGANATCSATATSSVAIGSGSSTSAIGAVCVGSGASVLAGATTDSIAIGRNTSFSATGGGVLVGTTGSVAFTSVVAVGLGAVVGAVSATAVGGAASAAGSASTAVGQGASAAGASSTALGSTATAAGASGTAVGLGASASALNSTAVGASAAASVSSSAAFGASAAASGSLSTALGASATASSADSTAVGQAAFANAAGATACGVASSVPLGATADSAVFGHAASFTAAGGGVIVGNAAAVAFTAAVVVGLGATVGTNQSTAVGDTASAGGAQSTAVGQAASAGGGSATAVGRAASAAGLSATAVGGGASAAFTQSTALGVNATCGLTNATALGANTSAGISSTVIGSGATAVAVASSVAVGAAAICSFTSSIVLGAGAADAGANQFIAGSDTAPITTTVIGRGPASATPSALVTWRTTDASGGSAATGSGLTIRAGNGDGAGANGALILAGGTGGTGGGTVTTNSGAFDTTFTARSASITVNQSGNTTLVGFTATSIVGALNELKATPPPSSTTLTATVAFAAGQLGYIDVANSVNLAVATADNISARVIGVAPSAITIATTGQIQTDGPVTALFVAGLTLVAGDEIFMSLTAGSATNDVSAFVAGNVVQSIGYLKDPLTYNGIGDLLAQVLLVRGPRLVL